MIITKLPNLKPNLSNRPDIGKAIKQARESCGLSQQELAVLVGFQSATALSLIEHNKRRISADTLWLISEVTQTRIL